MQFGAGANLIYCTVTVIIRVIIRHDETQSRTFLYPCSTVAVAFFRAVVQNPLWFPDIMNDRH